MRFVTLSVLIVTALIASNEANAEQVTSYLLPVVRSGQTNTMVAYNFWSGEYPGPVANVRSSRKGTTAVQAFKTLRKLGAPISCEIVNGIYHPWGNSPSVISWYSITPESTYTAKRSTNVTYNDNAGSNLTVTLKAGDKVTREIYLSEGFCQASINLEGKSTEVGTSCTNLSENSDLEHVVGAGQAEQWLYVQCADGTKAFIEDKALLAQPGVKEGQITGYGSVAP